MMNEPLDRSRNGFDDRDARRRRALWGLLVLAFAGVIGGSLMLLSSGGTPGKTAARHPAHPDSSAGTELTQPAGSSNGQSTPKPTPTASASPVIHTGNPCPTQPSCTVAGDAGLVAAVNKYRTDHHVPVVAGAATTNAQTCALHSGSGSTCVPHYVWTNVPSEDATLAVSRIADFAATWMLDPNSQRIDVGWAWNGKSWDCVLLKSP